MAPDPSVLRFREAAEYLRRQIDSVGKDVCALRSQDALANPPAGLDAAEVKENITLAFRKLEDARMRLGKAIQAAEGGVSINDKPRA